MSPPLTIGDLVRLMRTDNLSQARYRETAQAILITPQVVGRVGDVYLEPSTGQWHARVYWHTHGQWYAVNVPVTDFEKA